MTEPMMRCPAWEGVSPYDHEEDSCQRRICDGSGFVPMTAESQMMFLAGRFEGLRVWCPCKGVLRCADGYQFVSGCPGDEFPHDHTLVAHDVCMGRGWNPVPELTLAMIDDVMLPHGYYPQLEIDEERTDYGGFSSCWSVGGHDGYSLAAAWVLAIQAKEQADEV